MPVKPKRHWGLMTLMTVAAAAMSAATWVDQDWTVRMGQAQWPLVEALMNRSVFEGESLGANDLVILFLLAVTFVYYKGCRTPGPAKWAARRAQSGFILVSALVSAVYVVHSLKWALGRARPDLVIEKGMAFSHWFAYGPHFITDGIYYGSFPSGHTAQMFILMTGAYVLFGDPLYSRRVRWLGGLWAAVSVIASLAMGLTRCISLSHWLTDILGSVLMGWIIMHLLYYHILRVPAQRQYMAEHGTMPKLPDAWEVFLSIHLFVGTLGAAMIAIGARSLTLHKSAWLLLLVPGGIGFLWLAWNRAAALLRTVWHNLGGAGFDPALRDSDARP